MVLTAEMAAASREVQWNVGPWMIGLMYATMVAALAVFAYGTWLRVRIWRLGGPEVRWDRPGERVRRVLVHALAQRSVVRDRLPGVMHALIFFGFGVLFVATLVVMIHHDLGIPIMTGAFYLYFQSLAVNLFGALALLGVGIAIVRRYLVRPARLEHGRRADALLLALLFLILASGYLLSGLRIAATADPWAPWRPVAYLAARALAYLVPDPADLARWHAGTWIAHVIFWHALLAVTPFTKMFHAVSSPLNIFFGNLGARGTVDPIDFEDDAAAATLGARTPLDLSWKQLLDLDACTECGRCEAVCPAREAGTPLSPKRVVLDLRDHVREQAPVLRAAHAARVRGDPEGYESAVAGLPLLAGQVIGEEALWACTTCRACEEACPVSIEHVRLILRLRQNLAMDQARVPEGVADAVSGLEIRQHPFRGAPGDRAAWYTASVSPPPEIPEGR